LSLSHLRDRLHNWSRWCRQDEASVRSCIAGFWARWIPSKGWMAEWGDPDAVPEHDEHAIDAEDAERIDAFVRQLCMGHRSSLIRRYVHGHRPQTPYERDNLRQAIDALADLMGESTRTVRHLRILVRGRT
jgi:DNA-directed RNA polymerase specialized sigma24 family protein